MLHTTSPSFAYSGGKYLTEMSRLLSGRGKHERKLGRNYIRSHLRIATTYRAFFKDRYERGLRRGLLQAAFCEHGTDYPSAMSDLARQKLLFTKPMLIHLAQLEPMAFRSIVELMGSGIAPPPQDTSSRGLEKAYNEKKGYLCDTDEIIEELQRGGFAGNPMAKMSKEEIKNHWKTLIKP